MNKAAAQIANRPVEEVEGHSANEIFPNESEKYYNDDLEVINSGKPKLGIIEPATTNGVTTWLRTDKLPWNDADGNIAGIILFALDITDRIEAENKLRTSETRYRRLFESAKDGILILDAETGQIVDVNPFLFQMLGYFHNELLGKELWEIGVFKNIADSKEAFIELQNKGYIRFEDMPLETKNGQSINVEFVSNVYLVGQIKVIQCNIRDITKRRRAEEALRQSELRLHTLVQTIPDLIWLKDRDGVYLSCNTMFERFFGASEAEIVGKTDYDFMDRELADFFREHDRIAMIAGKPTSNEEWITFADDGHRALLDTIKTPMYDSKGVLTGVLGISHDITERKKSERKIQENEERFRKIFEEGPWGMVIINSDMHFERANTAFCKMTGYSEQELRSLTMKDITHPDHLKTDIENVQKLFRREISLYQTEKRYIRKNKVTIWSSITTTVVRDANGDFMYFLSMIEDITKRKQAEKEIKTLGKAIEQGPSSVVITNAKGKIEFVNNKFTSLTQYQLEDVRGKNPRIFNPGHLTEKEFEALWKTLQKGDTWKGEMLDHKKDKSSFWEEVNISAVTNPDGTIDNYILILNNISEKKQMLNDLIAAKEKAEEGNRLKSAFLSNMSHEIRTPMNAIMGFSALMKEDEGDEKNSYAEIIRNSSEKLLLLIDDVILLSRLQSEKMPVINTGFNPAGLVTEVSRMFNLPELNKNLDIKVNIPGQYKDLILRSDAIKIKLVLTNLASNAVKYTLEGSVELGFDLHDGKVEFYVEDTGIGIPEQEKQKIFETFYRGKQAISSAIGGTGLGLCIARELIELLHGEIGVTSELDKGSRFYFTIPFEQGEQGQSEKHPHQIVKKNRMDISILIADDEPVNFKYFEILLKGKVKNIDHAVNGKEAAEMASRNNYNLILMDMKMPVMGGIEATKILKQKFPELPIIAQTAYTFPEERETAVQAGCDDFLTKPIKKGDLMEIINKYI